MEALLLLLVALSLGGSGSNAPGDPVAMSKGRNTLAALLARAPLDETQRGFLILTAYGESRWSSGAANRSASEAAAAGRAYDRHADFFRDRCGPRSGYAWGSGGWFGLLPANPLWILRNSGLACWPGSYVFDPVASIVAALAFGRQLQGWSGFQTNPTVINLRIGWGNPSAMGEPHDPAKVAKFVEHARKAGLGETFLLRPVNRFPGNYAAIFAALSGGA